MHNAPQTIMAHETGIERAEMIVDWCKFLGCMWNVGGKWGGNWGKDWSRRTNCRQNWQLSRRFTAMNEVIDNFSILFPANLVAANEHTIRTAAEDLQKWYSCDLTEGFSIKFLTFT